MKSSFLALLVLVLVLSCEKDSPEPSNLANRIVIPNGTKDTVLFAKSIDDKVIPIFFSFPEHATYPLPGTVVLHGSGGNWKDEDTDNDGIADKINEWQLSTQNQQWNDIFHRELIISAFPDSYSSRGTIENEGPWKNPPLQFKISATFIRNYDAYLTLDLLRKMVWSDGTEMVKPNKVALLGFSHGATAVQSTLFDTQAANDNRVWSQNYNGVQYTDEIKAPAPLPVAGGFVAGVMYYPGSFHNSYYGNPCSGTSIYRTYADFMIHLPSDDGLTDNSLCMLETVQNNNGGNPVIHHYEGTDHGFDGNNSTASNVARQRTLTFLKSKLQ